MWDPAAAGDWLEKAEERLWEKIDDYVIEALETGQMNFVGVAATHAARLTLATGSKLVTGTVADLLRLGTFDPDDTSVWGITKGVVSNGLRLLAVAGPAGRAVGFAGRHAALTAASQLSKITKTAGPCGSQSLMNVFSLLRRSKTQIFHTGDDLLKAFNDVAPGTSTILNSPKLTQLLAQFGLGMRQAKGMNSIDDVVAAAQRSGSPITFTIEYIKASGQSSAHRLTAFRDSMGRVKILDYFENKGPGFTGYNSIKDYIAARSLRPGSTVLRTGSPVVEWFSTSRTDAVLLSVANLGVYRFGFPYVFGLRPNGGLGAFIAGLLSFFDREHPDEPLPDLTFNPPPEYKKVILVPRKPPYWYTVREGVPQEDWPSARAGKEYGDVLLWPIILEATQAEQRKLGKVTWLDQNKILPGQRIFVPDISGLSQQKKAAARKRGADWKRVG